MFIRTIVVHLGLLEIENGSKDALAEIFLHYFIEVVSLHSDI